ncbi:MAG: SIS domain-containing protein [Anaeromyxobacter sp.]
MTHFEAYVAKAQRAMASLDLAEVERLATALRAAWREDRQVFVCGNGGSAANALHLVNDLFFGAGRANGGKGLRAIALPANQAVTTCLANDVGYDAVFSRQLEVLGRPGDLLVVLSGSGNSPNVVAAIEAARRGGLVSFAVLGFSGGKCLALADHAIHLRLDDMQIAEDVQMLVGHMITQWLAANPPVEGEVTTPLRVVAGGLYP